jgi:hypothetical protein
MHSPDVAGSLAITWPADGKPGPDFHVVDTATGIDLTPATTRVNIEMSPGGRTLAWLTMFVDPASGAVLDGEPRGVQVEFCYEVESMRADPARSAIGA